MLRVLGIHLRELLLIVSHSRMVLPLMLASQEGHERIVETLLRGGARVDMHDEVPLY